MPPACWRGGDWPHWPRRHYRAKTLRGTETVASGALPVLLDLYIVLSHYRAKTLRGTETATYHADI